MKVSYSWLKDYIDIKLSPQKIIENLTMAGLEVVHTEKKGDDFIFEIEVTTNRPDWLSVIGIARELAAITGGELKLPKTDFKTENRKPKTENRITIFVEDKTDCPRYIGTVLTDVKVGPSPKWLKEKIEAIGMRSVNNVVDITNFCLIEWGQPLHAFDLDKLKGQKIIVRRAHDKEEMQTIDGQRRILDKETLVIADSNSSVALAGIMGGEFSEVCEATKNILLESAYFKPELIRKTSKKLGVSTESSFRFERFVDFDVVKTASVRAASLIEDITGAKFYESIDKISIEPEAKKGIVFDVNWANRVLDTDIKEKTIKDFLKNLGFSLTKKRKNLLEVKAPSFRRDVVEAVDLVEEIARLYGYHNIDSSLPNLSTSREPLESRLYIFNLIRGILTSAGFDELITYSLIDKDLLSNWDANKVLSIENPLSKEQECMRPALLPSLVDIARKNLNKGNANLRLFEIANVYSCQGPKHTEKVSLAMLICADRFNNWQDKKREADFFDIKGAVELLFKRIGILDYDFSQAECPLFSKAANCTIKLNEELVGICGLVNEDFLSGLDIKEKVFAAEVFLETLIPKINLEKVFRNIPKFPQLLRDISIVSDKDLEAAKILSAIKERGESLVREVILFDQYLGQQIPAGKRGLSFSIHYQSDKRTLTDKEVDELHKKICDGICAQFAVQIR